MSKKPLSSSSSSSSRKTSQEPPLPIKTADLRPWSVEKFSAGYTDVSGLGVVGGLGRGKSCGLLALTKRRRHRPHAPTPPPTRPFLLLQCVKKPS